MACVLASVVRLSLKFIFRGITVTIAILNERILTFISL